MNVLKISCLAFTFLIASFLASGQTTDPVLRSIELRTADNVMLHVDVYMPSAEGPHPAILILQGGGGPKFTSEFYRPVAERWARLGYVAILFDKRGVGKSGGRFMEVNIASSAEVFATLASDAQLVVEEMVRQKYVNKYRMGICALSQGGWVAARLLSACDLVKFAVIVSGPAVTMGEEDYYSKLTGDERPGQDYVNNDAISISDAIVKVKTTDSKKGFDPFPYLSKLRIPVIWLYGAKDRSVPVDLCLENLEKIKNAMFTVKVYPNHNHNLVDISTKERVNMYGEAHAWISSLK